ncbi:MAG: DUF4980 domain-containing protein, partial [Bacteroidales bacterium]|nr:DUF4980 domain-containing protein [Bacteroidales bacterium]
MKKLMTTLAAVLLAVAVNAQVMPEVLGENHAMLRLEQGKKYILLPVEDRAANATVKVIGKDNMALRKPDVRLAVDKVDYLVPLEIQDGQTLDIIFPGYRKQSGNVKDFACWKEMRYSDTFDETNRERFRPAYHHTPKYGWMNDPNGMFYKDGEWHLCYQYNPYGSRWGNISWGHSVSKDLIHWETLPTAIEPDGLGGIWSGSAVVDKNNTAGYGAGTIVAYYTSGAEAQTQSMAYSTDGGRTFKKYEKNPVIVSDVPDFRDPKVFWYEGTNRWIMIVTIGPEYQFYSSPNLKDWTMENTFGREYGHHGGVWECPELIRLPVRGTGQQKWMVICNLNTGGPFGGSATQYFVGQFDGHKFTCESKPSVTKWMDYGKDHYATVTFDNAPELALRNCLVGTPPAYCQLLI